MADSKSAFDKALRSKLQNSYVKAAEPEKPVKLVNVAAGGSRMEPPPLSDGKRTRGQTHDGSGIDNSRFYELKGGRHAHEGKYLALNGFLFVTS